MAIQIAIKTQIPSIEIQINIPGISKPLFVGCKLHGKVALDALRTEYVSLLTDNEQARLQAQLDQLIKEGDRTSEDYYVEQNKLTTRLSELAKSSDKRIEEFYKSQILYLRSCTLSFKDEEGATKDIVVADTREAAPIEPLWSSAEECLAVLLDLYFDFPGLGGSLIENVGNAVFQNNTSAITAKIKNS